MRRPGGVLVVGAALLGGWALGGGCAASGVPRSRGATLHRAKCTSCHVRPEPTRFDRGGWARVLDAHRDRLRLQDDERRALLDHLAARPSTR